MSRGDVEVIEVRDVGHVISLVSVWMCEKSR